MTKHQRVALDVIILLLTLWSLWVEHPINTTRTHGAEVER
jgi:hypothetical protein